MCFPIMLLLLVARGLLLLLVARGLLLLLLVARGLRLLLLVARGLLEIHFAFVTLAYFAGFNAV